MDNFSQCFFFDDSTTRDSTAIDLILLYRGTLATYRETTHREGALTNGIDLAIGTTRSGDSSHP